MAKLVKDGEEIYDSPIETNPKDGEENLESLEQFNNESFHETLMNKIIDEIKKGGNR